MWFVVAAFLAAVSTNADTFEDATSSENPSKELVQNLRRQLMFDNSDYSIEQSNNTKGTHVRVDSESDKSRNKNRYYASTVGTYERAIDNGVRRHIKKADYSVSAKDLLYYIDDDKLVRKKPHGRRYFGYESAVTDKNLSNVKYKTLKLRHQRRRSGSNRYIQVEGEDGVAIVSLDKKGPFPEIRLPRSRRQYKHDHGAAMTDDEDIPPPTVDSGDPEAAAESLSLHATTF